MSLTIKSKTSAKQLVAFLYSEYAKNTGIPVHLYSVVNATFSHYNKTLAIADGAGCIFFESDKLWKSYGSSNPSSMLRALNQCNVGLKIIE